jgi:serine/threonine protein kinase/tetratricopeptide (TPR) repeat protein
MAQEWRVIRAETSASEFTGTQRYEVLRQLGAGGMGVVYEVRDREQGTRVALKVLSHVESWALLRFKQEFRALADVNHPNLVGLHELVYENGLWFVTMELVHGVDFLSWVRPGQLGHADTLVVSARRDEPASFGSRSGAIDEPRLRHALYQLCVGVSALHGLGKLHRDIKPSNVLVTPEGRVVLLDFGLVTELAKGRAGESANTIVGTAAYMAPEQAAAGQITEASDWYAVGVMLYEALTGILPFSGTVFEVLMAKQMREAGPPSELAPALPSDLETLCRALVRKDPLERPGAAEVLQRLRESERPPPLPSLRPEAIPLVGREAEHDLLRAAFESAALGTPVSLVVQGMSGMGKSSLVRAFLTRIEGRALVLSGRCYERESVPYKAVDSLVDALGNELLTLPAAELSELLPADAPALARVFPVLSRIELLSKLRMATPIRDASELRSRAFAALRELLKRLAKRRPIVLCIDDLQWGDADSGVLLRELLAPPHPPPIMLLCCHRSEDAEASPLLATLFAPQEGVEVYEITLPPLPAAKARELAQALLGEVHVHAGGLQGSDERAARVAREAQGNPFLLVQLAQHVAGGSDLESGEVSFETLMRARMLELPVDAGSVLELVALSGCPISRELVRDAAGLGGLDEALAPLRARQLLRSSGVRGRETLECYHDRIRETVCALLSPARAAALHRQLAHALVNGGASDPETIALHFHAAGEPARAGAWAEIAAERAAAALAFEHAAKLYRNALAWRTRGDDERRELSAKLADALSSAGRGQEAAEAYRVAADGAERTLALSRRQQAARQLLRAGYIEEGVQGLSDVFSALGMEPAKSRGRMLAALIYLRARIWLRGYEFVERTPEQVPEEERLRVDATWSLSTVLSTIDALRGPYFQAQHVLAALALGEPSRVACALASDAVILQAMSGARGSPRPAQLFKQAHELAQRVGDVRADATVTLFEALCDTQLGNWRKAIAGFANAELVLRQHCSDAAWELDVAQLFSGLAMIRTGQLEELQQHVQRLLREAEERGNRYLKACVPGWLFATWLAADKPADLRRAERAAMAAWSPVGLSSGEPERSRAPQPPPGFHLQHLCALLARVAADLYEGDGQAALGTVEAEWEALRGSLLFNALITRTEGWDMRGRAALAAAACATGKERRAALEIARRAASRLARERSGLALALGLGISAGCAALGDEPLRAAELFAAAADALDRLDMSGYAACMRMCQGDLVGGVDGARQAAAAERLLRERKVRMPRRFAAVFAPSVLAR